MLSKSRKLKNLNSSGSSSSSFKGLSCVSSFGKGDRSCGRIAAEWLEIYYLTCKKVEYFLAIIDVS
ncbi:E3 ubiquitin-protein ligase XBAT3 [Spatholobus suberectus]|nr:E3 ubiquitin-protein ligase XBAT3 [Spatholobus suberectus]